MTERLWSDWIDVIDGKQPDALRGVKTGEWEYANAHENSPFTGTFSMHEYAWLEILRVRILLPEGWQPASTLPSDETLVDVRWNDGDHSDDTLGCAVAAENLLLCWRPHVSPELSEMLDAMKAFDPECPVVIGHPDPNFDMLQADEPKPAEPAAPTVLRWPAPWVRESNLLRVADVGEKRWGACDE